MPSKNIRKIYTPDSYYHIYNRGVNKGEIFLDDQDYRTFLYKFKRMLSPQEAASHKGQLSKSLIGNLDLNAFCLMPNHFHLMVYQKDANAIQKLLQSISTSYVMYFNRKYSRIGPLFQSRYKASLITNEEYFEHISCYIHLNPNRYSEWKYSSLPYYLNSYKADWIHPEKIMQSFASPEEYSDRLKSLKLNSEVNPVFDSIDQGLA